MAATILVTEVDVDIRIVFSRLLRRAGYHVITAPDRATGMRTAVDHAPDLVIINLRDDDGPELCRQLHADPRTEHTPVLLMSAELYPDAAAAAGAGAEDYLTKPLANDTLLQHVHALLRARTPSRTVAPAAAWTL